MHKHFINPWVARKNVDNGALYFIPVSYTHLDVYKRQVYDYVFKI